MRAIQKLTSVVSLTVAGGHLAHRVLNSLTHSGEWMTVLLNFQFATLGPEPQRLLLARGNLMARAGSTVIIVDHVRKVFSHRSGRTNELVNIFAEGGIKIFCHHLCSGLNWFASGEKRVTRGVAYASPPKAIIVIELDRLCSQLLPLVNRMTRTSTPRILPRAE